MLSRTGAAAIRSASQKGLASSAVASANSSGSSARALASTPFPDFPIPEAIRDAVKSTVLDEATKPDSKFWRSGDSSSASSAASASATASAASTSQHAQQYVNGGLHNNMNGSYASINDPIARDRAVSAAPSNSDSNALDILPLIHHDPLDEWYLDRIPTRQLHVLPPNVRPMSDGADPFLLSRSDLETLSASIRRDLIGSDHADHPILAKAAAHFFEAGHDGGKKVRPMMVMLLSRAMAGSVGLHEEQADSSNCSSSSATTYSMPVPFPWQRQDLPDAQRRLAEISEMIHTASLFHDDVIDGADTRRGAPAVHRVFGNKMAILAGDYLLARASIYLARLRDVEVVETMSTIIEHLVRGEVMQSNGAGDVYNERMVYYLRKNFYKTGSLMANSCKSAALLGGYDDAIVSAAYRYGKHIGMAFQLVDDVLDFDGSSSTMGKAALADLNAGLATAPVLFAAEHFPNEMDRLIERKFSEAGDVNRAVELVRQSDGIERTKDLAHVYVELAIDAVMEIEASPYRDSLVHLAYKIVDRVR